MTGMPACPSETQLRQYVGRCSDAEQVEELASHLEVCERCGETVDQLLAQDTLAEIARGKAGTAELLPDSLMREVAGRAHGLRTREQTLDLPAGELDLSFLAPPQTADELGWLGPYRVLEILGAGGMGVVFRADDPQLQRPVALKAMLPKLAAGKSAKHRFLREARAAAALKHDHIVSIYQVGEDRGCPFLAMEFLEGESLETRLHRDKALPIAEVLRMGREIAEGLGAAHERGLIHRDIKPGNIWLEGKRARVKLLDFGLARAADDQAELTQEGAIVGTPGYMAPEQASAAPVDCRCDLFSLGCVLYRLCTGRPAFKGKNSISTLVSATRDTPPAPRQVEPAVPEALSQLIMQLLAKTAEERPASAQAVAEALAVIENDVVRQADASLGSTRTKVTPVAGSTLHRRKVMTLTAMLALMAAALAAFFVIRVPTPEGEFIIETDNKEVAVAVENRDTVILVDLQSGNKYQVKSQKLPAGDYELIVRDSKAGLEFSTRKFTIRAKDRPASVRVWFQKKDEGIPQAATPAVAAKDSPFVLLRADGKREEFKHLVEAATVVQTGDVIEVYGNGPFQVPQILMNGRGLDLRAAPGFRPLFKQLITPDFVKYDCWLVVNQAPLRLEGCDFYWENGAALQGGGQPWELRNCRFLRLNHGVLGNYAGPKISISDCLLAINYSPLHLGPNVEAVFTNNIIHAPFAIGLAQEGGQIVRMVNNSLDILHFASIPNASLNSPVTVEASGNAFLNRGLSGIFQRLNADVLKNFLWQGRDNLYVTSLMGPAGNDGLFNDLAAWKKATGSEETGSRQVRNIHFHSDRFRTSEVAAVERELRGIVEAMAKKHGLADLGPQWDLIGPGDAYVRALAAAGKPVPKDQLRPAAPPSGPFVLLRDGQVAAAFRTLEAAGKAAKDGDVIEIRTDGPFPGTSYIRSQKTEARRLTIRSAPGYRPVVEGDLRVYAPDRFTIEGLLFRKGTFNPSSGESQVLRTANCAFESPPKTGIGFEAEANHPAEIVNCWFPEFIQLKLFAGDKLLVRNSVLGPLNLAHVPADFEKSVLLEPLTVYASTEAVAARACLFAGAHGPLRVYNQVPRWSGTGNVYLSGQLCLLDTLKKQYGSPETDSATDMPLLWNPQEWRLVPEQGVGADVDRIARPRSPVP